MKSPQTFEDLLSREIGDEFDPKPRVNLADDDEGFYAMHLHAIGWEGPVSRRIPSVLPRTAGYAERLAEWRANKDDGVPEELC